MVDSQMTYGEVPKTVSVNKVINTLCGTCLWIAHQVGTHALMSLTCGTGLQVAVCRSANWPNISDTIMLGNYEKQIKVLVCCASPARANKLGQGAGEVHKI